MSPGDSDDAPLDLQVVAMENAIQWIASRGYLIAGTLGEEARISGSLDKPLTADNINVKVQTTHGSATGCTPLKIGPALVFLQHSRRSVMELAYSSESDSFQAPDLAMLAEHITLGGIDTMAYAQSPDSIIWAVRNDGTLLGLTYYRAEDVIGWHRHTTDGFFKSVAVIPTSMGSAAGYSQVWFVVQRTIDGSIVQYIEYMADHEAITDQEDYFCVDSGLIYDGTPVSNVTGLGHLEGETVAIVADGVVQPSQVVTLGTLSEDLEETASVIHVGLPYTCALKTMRLDVGNNGDGTTMGVIKKIHSVTLRVLNSIGGKYGTNDDDLRPIPYWVIGSHLVGVAAELKTGDFKVLWPGGNGTDAQVYIVQDQPLPLTLLAIVAEMTTSD
jgi:hypothetical protein